MSVLKEALNRILTWLAKHKPNVALSLQPGLTDEEIDEKIKDWSGQLPGEVRELYKWHNGSEDRYFYDNFDWLPVEGFISLEKAIETYYYLLGSSSVCDEMENPNWLPIYSIDGGYMIVIGDEDRKTLSISWLWLKYNEIEMYYPNLTNLMLALDSCYETGAYYLEENGELQEKEQKVAEIECQYNCNTTDTTLTDPTEVERLVKILQTPEPISTVIQRTIVGWELNLCQYLDPDPDSSYRYWENDIYDTVGRRNAAYVLGDLRDSRAFDPLVEALGDRAGEVRSNAAMALGKLGDSRAVESLILRLQDRDFFVRTEAARSLGELRDIRAVEPLIRMLKKEQDANAKGVAAEALGNIGDIRAIDPLLEAREGDNIQYLRWVRPFVAKALAMMDEPRARDAAMEVLRERNAFQHLNYAYSRLPQVIEALLETQAPRLIEVLIEKLRDPDSDVRLTVLSFIIDVKDSRLVDALLFALDDEKDLVRENAIEALGYLQEKRAVVSLVEMLDDEDIDVRSQIILALGRIKDSRAVEPLIEMLKDGDRTIRGIAIWALGEIKDSRAIAPLSQFEEGDLVVQMIVREALIKIS